MHPVVVAKTREGYVLISGHRRLRAFRSMRRKTIPALVKKNVRAKDLALDMYIENALREDLRPEEKAKAVFQTINTLLGIKGDVFKALSLVGAVKQWKKRGAPKALRSNLKGMGQSVFKCERILSLLGMSENTAISYLRLLLLPESILTHVESAHRGPISAVRRRKEGYISVKQAYELSRIADPKLQKHLYEKVVAEGWNYWVLRSVVDEMLESGIEALQVSKHGASGKQDADYATEKITKKCFKLGGTLWSWRQQKLTMMRMSLHKSVMRAGLKNLRRSCKYLLDEIDLALEGPARFKARKRAEAETGEFDVKLKGCHGGIRFSFPKKITNDLGVEAGDTVRFKVRKVKAT